MFEERKTHMESEIANMNRALDMLRFKCWYYEQAIQDGSEDRLEALIPDDLPEEIKEAYENAHAQYCHPMLKGLRTGIPFQVGMQKESLRTREFGGRYSHYFAGDFALGRRRGTTRRYSAVSKREFRSQFPLLPLGGSVSAVSSFQLRPVFGAVSSRVPPGDTMSRFVGPGDKN